VVKKKVPTVAASVSSKEVFPMAGLALQLEVPTAAANIPGLKVGEECWNSDLHDRLEVVAATLKSARLRETLPKTSSMLDPYENPVT
jgi:hypothetical protein